MGGLGALDEKLHRFAAPKRFGCGGVCIGQSERGNSLGSLTSEAERLPAAGDDLRTRAGMQEFVGQPRAGFNQVFAVAEQEYERFSTQVIGQDFLKRTAWGLAQSKDDSQRRDYIVGVGQRR